MQWTRLALNPIMLLCQDYAALERNITDTIGSSALHQAILDGISRDERKMIIMFFSQPFDTAGSNTAGQNDTTRN